MRLFRKFLPARSQIQPSEMATTRDAFMWTPEEGLRHGGFACEGAVTPPVNVKSPQGTVYDVLIVGGGYAGLAAARDLTNAGRSVLLIEGRDRVGGRSYTIEHNGYKWEMGGTWIFHTQPYTHREVMRYKMDLIRSRDPSHKNNFYSINVPGSQRNLSHEEASQIVGKVWKLFVNIDGAEGKNVCPLPYQQSGNTWVDSETVKKVDAYSCYDRFQEIKHLLSEEEQGVLTAVIINLAGGKPDMKNSGYWDMIRSHAINGHQMDLMDEIWINYKMKDGSSHLSRQIFNDAVDCGLQYTFKSHVSRIEQKSNLAQIFTRDGRVFKGRKVICTAPLNTLKSIKFDPPLGKLRQEAANAGHTNFMTKCHAIVKGPDFASWAGACHPSPLNMAFGDGLTPEGDAHMTAFGCDWRDHFVLEDAPEKLVEAWNKFHPMDVKTIAFHNWNTDEYTQGGPCFMPPKFMTTYMEELRKPHGNVYFANADWAQAWRNFIDGALEQGTLNGIEVLRQLRTEDKSGIRKTEYHL